MRIKTILLTLCCLLFIIPSSYAHSIPYDKRLYSNESSGLYSNMNIYLTNVDNWWWKVAHAHQSFNFGYSTVKDSQLEYFKITDQMGAVIFNGVGSKKTSNYDNSFTPNVNIYKGDNYLQMRVKNRDIQNVNGYIQDYYWYESVYWSNV
ncbi:MAG: hypothetical protein ABS939_00565 [Psychrobacillus sp.]